MDFKLLDIFVELQVLITQREAMLAENQQRVHLGEAMAYTEASFYPIIAQMTSLRSSLRQ